jgi:hypothetical protein
MLLRLTAAADTVADTAVATLAAGTLVVDTSVVDTSVVADTLRPDISGLGTDRAREWWFGVDPPYTSGLDLTRAHSRVDTSAISGMAVGGITALARAGYGRTIPASMCGLATKVLERHFGDLNGSPPL